LATVVCDKLPVPPGLISLESIEGELLLRDNATISADFWILVGHFTTQDSNAYCGVASAITVLNALPIDAPLSEMHDGYHYWDQNNFFDENTDSVASATTIQNSGMTLNQLGQFMEAHQVSADVHHAQDSTVEEFRTLGMQNLAEPRNFMIINYNRQPLQEQGDSGHISPIGAYSPARDMFLLMDVARYKYPPMWVKTADLFNSINTNDPVSGLSRGYVFLSVKGEGKTSYDRPDTLNLAGILAMAVIFTILAGMVCGGVLVFIAMKLWIKRQQKRARGEDVELTGSN
jgi:hypothetical protein